MFLLFLSFMLGLSLLLPWNSLLKSLPYIMMRVPVEWRETAPLWLTLTFTLTNCLVLLGLTLSDADSRVIRQICGGEAVSTEKIVRGRLYGGLAGCAVLLVLACATPLIDLFDKSNDKGTGSLSHLLLFWGIFISTGWIMCLLQRSVYPMMSLLPGKKESLVPAMLTGQAVAGIAASMGSFLFAGSSVNGGNGADAGAGVALIYFGCSIAALLGTAGLYRYYEIKYVSKDHQGEKQQSRIFSIGVLIETARDVKPWPQLLSLNFAVTLSLFPGLLTSSARSLQSNGYFIPLTFLVFDAFDLLGKVMPSMFRSGLGPKSMLAMGLPVLRILFIPMFLVLPNFKGAPSLNSDWPYFVTLALMAWTSGWGNAICLINGPQKVSEPTEEMGDRVGSLMGLSITVGLLLGSGSSVLLKTLVN